MQKRNKIIWLTKFWNELHGGTVSARFDSSFLLLKISPFFGPFEFCAIFFKDGSFVHGILNNWCMHCYSSVLLLPIWTCRVTTIVVHGDFVFCTAIPCAPGIQEHRCSPETCDNVHCPAFPSAVCIINACGGCNPQFQLPDGTLVDDCFAGRGAVTSISKLWVTHLANHAFFMSR